jgi:type I restriction enzyme S subunit
LIRQALSLHGGGTNISNLNQDILGRLEVPLPPKPVQCKIASILSAYDDLIENNTRRIKVLEGMAKMIYREWFINFRFPGYGKVKMVESGMGQVPKGWGVQTVTDAIEVDPMTKVPKEGMKPFVAMGGLSHVSMLISDIERREGNSGSKFRNGDTLFARITPSLENGKTGFVQFLPDFEAVGFGSTEFIVLRSRTVTPEYVYLMARSDEFRENAIKSMTGASGRQRVQEACFGKYLIAQPPAGLLRNFQNVVMPMFRLVYVLSVKNENLRKTRDMLLPKLISGDISVESEAEAVQQDV